jgi:non-homologous end joining protein Ku
MRGDNHVLAVTTTTDEVSNEVRPLLYFPIQVCKATDDREVKFDIAAPSGAPRKQVYTDESSGEVVEDAACLRGVKVGDVFNPIDPEAIAKINEATKIDTMIVIGTVDFTSIPWDRSTGTYFVQSPAKGGAPKIYRLIYEALLPVKAKKGTPAVAAKALVTKRTARSRQKLCVIYADPAKECLMLQELRFASTLREPDEQVKAPMLAQVEEAQIEKARSVIAGLGDGAVAIDNEVDDAVALKADLIEQALAGETLSVPTPIAQTAASDDLSAMLEASLAAV